MPLVTAAVTCTITRSRPRPVLATPVAAATTGTLVGGFLPSPADMAACVDVGVVTRSTVAAPVATVFVRVAVATAAALAAVAMLALVLAPPVLALVLALMSMLVLVLVLVALVCCVAPSVGAVIATVGNGVVQPKLWDVEPMASARELYVAHGQLHRTWPIRSATYRCRVQQSRQISSGGGAAAVPAVSVAMFVPPMPVSAAAVCAAIVIATSIASCVTLHDDGCRDATPTGATTPAAHHQVPPVEEGEEHSN